MADPYYCLRWTSVGIGFYNIIYSIAQLFILSWQVKTVKKLQWEYENRLIPMNGASDTFQARFPGLFALYTETPERRRINAMFTIVLICLVLSIVHFITTTFMLYGVIKRFSNWIIPWFFTCAPLIVMCTSYSVLWWSGDVFNEQLTMSVAEFVSSLAINGISFIVVLLYFLRLTGKLTADYPENFLKYNDNFGEHTKNSFNSYSNNLNYPHKHSPSSAEYKRNQSPCLKPEGCLPPWYPTMPNEPSYNLNQKLKRRERRRSLNPSTKTSSNYLNNFNNNLYKHENFQENNFELINQSTNNFLNKNKNLLLKDYNNVRKLDKENCNNVVYSDSKKISSPTSQFARSKNPFRVSFTQSKPTIYERTPNSSLSDFEASKNAKNMKIYTVV